MQSASDVAAAHAQQLLVVSGAEHSLEIHDKLDEHGSRQLQAHVLAELDVAGNVLHALPMPTNSTKPSSAHVLLLASNGQLLLTVPDAVMHTGPSNLRAAELVMRIQSDLPVVNSQPHATAEAAAQFLAPDEQACQPSSEAPAAALAAQQAASAALDGDQPCSAALQAECGSEAQAVAMCDLQHDSKHYIVAAALVRLAHTRSQVSGDVSAGAPPVACTGIMVWMLPSIASGEHAATSEEGSAALPKRRPPPCAPCTAGECGAAHTAPRLMSHDGTASGWVQASHDQLPAGKRQRSGNAVPTMNAAMVQPQCLLLGSGDKHVQPGGALAITATASGTRCMDVLTLMLQGCHAGSMLNS